MQEEEVRGPIELTEENVDEPSDTEGNEEGNFNLWNVDVWFTFNLLLVQENWNEVKVALLHIKEISAQITSL